MPQRVVTRGRDDADGCRYTLAADTTVKSAEIRLHPPPAGDAGGLRWNVTLLPRATWELCAEVIVSVDENTIEPRFRCTATDGRRSRHSGWRRGGPRCRRSTPTTPGFGPPIRRTGEDLGALRIFDPEHPDVPIVAAGAPWFMTVFGRDSLLTAWMTLLADPTPRRWACSRRWPGSRATTSTRRPRRSRARSSTRCASAPRRGLVARRRRRLLRLGRRHAAVRDAARRAAPLGPRRRRRRRGCSRTPTARSPGSRSSATATATATSSTSAAATAGLANQGWKDSWDAHPPRRRRAGRPRRSRCARCRATCTRRTWPGPTSPPRPATPRPLERYRDKAADAAPPVQRGLLARGARLVRPRPRRRQATDRRARLQHRATACGPASSTPSTRRGRGRAARVAARCSPAGASARWPRRWPPTTRSATTTAPCGRTTTRICAAGLARYGFVDEAHRVIEAQLDVAAAFERPPPRALRRLRRAAARRRPPPTPRRARRRPGPPPRRCCGCARCCASTRGRRTGRCAIAPALPPWIRAPARRRHRDRRATPHGRHR